MSCYDFCSTANVGPAFALRSATMCVGACSFWIRGNDVKSALRCLILGP